MTVREQRSLRVAGPAVCVQVEVLASPLQETQPRIAAVKWLFVRQKLDESRIGKLLFRRNANESSTVCGPSRCVQPPRLWDVLRFTF